MTARPVRYAAAVLGPMLTVAMLVSACGPDYERTDRPASGVGQQAPGTTTPRMQPGTPGAAQPGTPGTPGAAQDR